MDAPQLFHNKVDYSPYAAYPIALLKSLNHALTGNELKVMLVYLSCKGDGSFCPSTEYMLQMTGIADQGNYYRARKGLIKKGYLTVDKREIIIDVKKLIDNI